MSLYNVIVETTRRCNMRCDHCLRGDAENRDMPNDVMHRLISLLEGYYISDLTIGGGEFTTAPKIFNELVNMIVWRNVKIGGYYMVTNTKVFPTSVKKYIRMLHNYVEEPEMSSIDYSNDQFHDVNFSTIDRWNRFLWEELGIEDGLRRKFPKENPSRWLRVGRANNISETHPIEIYPYQITEYGIEEGELYVNVFGEVLPSCNMSYTLQDTKKLSLGNIMDTGFNFIEAAEKWNKKHFKNSGVFVVNEYEYYKYGKQSN